MAFIRPPYGWWLEGVAAVVSSNKYWSQQATCLAAVFISIAENEFYILGFVPVSSSGFPFIFHLFLQEANI